MQRRQRASRSSHAALSQLPSGAATACRLALAVQAAQASEEQTRSECTLEAMVAGAKGGSGREEETERGTQARAVSVERLLPAQASRPRPPPPAGTGAAMWGGGSAAAQWALLKVQPAAARAMPPVVRAALVVTPGLLGFAWNANFAMNQCAQRRFWQGVQ